MLADFSKTELEEQITFDVSKSIGMVDGDYEAPYLVQTVPSDQYDSHQNGGDSAWRGYSDGEPNIY